MQSGKLRNRVRIEHIIRSVDENGQPVESWATFATRWADIRNVAGKEFYAQDKPNMLATHNIFIRWTDGVDETMRIVWDSRTFNIIHVGEDRTHGKNMPLVCMENK